ALRQIDQERRAPATLQRIGRALPDLLPSLAVKRVQRLALGGGVHDDEVFVDDGARARPEAHRRRTGADRILPDLVPFQIEGEAPRLAEEDVDALAVGGRRAGGVAVPVKHPIGPVLVGDAFNLLMPEDLSALFVDTDENPLDFAAGAGVT